MDIPQHYKTNVFNIHKLVGLIILMLTLLRLGWRFINPMPMLSPFTPLWERIAERTVHTLLYIAIIAMPIAGWIGSSAAGRFPHIGTVNIKPPFPVPLNKFLVQQAFVLYYILAISIASLISIQRTVSYSGCRRIDYSQ